MREVKLIQYKPGIEQDCLLTHWYMMMIATKELHQTFTELSLSAFLRSFQLPHHLIYAQDSGNGHIWFAAWFDPVFDGALLGIWADKSKRPTKVGLATFEAAIEYGLARWPVLVSVTRQEKLLDEHRRLGYTLVGKLPMFWGGENAWILHLTREGFDSREVRLIVRSDKSDRGNGSNNLWVAAVKAAV